MRRILCLALLLLPVWGRAETITVTGKIAEALLASKPGDTIRVPWRQEPYRERLLITQSVTLEGVPSATGERPTIDGFNAYLDPGFKWFWDAFKDYALLMISRYTYGTRPSDVTVRGLHLRNAGATYTDGATGQQRTPVAGAAGIYIYPALRATIEDCEIESCPNGLFAKSATGQVTEDLVVRNCHIHDNGTVGSDQHHNVYTESLHVLFDGCTLGPLRPGAKGNSLKDRSAGTTIRNCRLELTAPAHLLDLVEPQDGYEVLSKDPQYGHDEVSNCTLINRAGGSASLVHYGGDCIPANYRPGTLAFNHNTVVDYTTIYRTIVWKLEDNRQTVQASDCVLYSANSKRGTHEWTLMGANGQLTLGRNWISPGWVEKYDWNNTGTAVILGTANLYGTSAGPGFVSPGTDDYSLLPGAEATGCGATVPAQPPPPAAQGRTYTGTLKAADGSEITVTVTVPK